VWRMHIAGAPDTVSLIGYRYNWRRDEMVQPTRPGPRRTCGAALLALTTLLTATVAAQAPTHELRLTPEHVHWGYYDATLTPVLRIASGDRVRVETMIAGGLQRLRLAGATEAEIPDALKMVE